MIKSNVFDGDDTQIKPTISANPFSDLKKKDSEVANILRPVDIAQYIGQGTIVKQLDIILQSAKMRETIPEHIMFYGQPGLGKTTLATLISNELGIDMKMISAPSLQKVGDIASILISLDRPTVVFIDEIHRMRTQIEETLYTAMEDRKIDIVIGKGQGVNTMTMDLAPFILIGATTQFGKISKPLRDRFPTIFKMETYSDEEIKKLLHRSMSILNLTLDEKSVDYITSRTRGVPRVANNVLKRLLDLQTVHHAKTLNYSKVVEFLDELGVYDNGLTRSDITYLTALKNGSVGVKTISGILLEETDTIEETIEPFLINLGFVDKSSSGRRLTTKGYGYLEKIGLLDTKISGLL
jgi:holliday junction DNA helicase RuvB